MNLIRALRLHGAPRIALVGAGGKTGILLALAAAYRRQGKDIFLTTTTHLSSFEAESVSNHLIVRSPDDLDPVSSKPIVGDILVTGPPGPDGKLSAPGPEILRKLAEIAAGRYAPLVCEADGSRRLPLKAPAGHEPAIPDFCDQVIVVAGLSGLGLSLGPRGVHRSDDFSRLSGAKPGSSITPEILAKVLSHPQGGLKNIPSEARRVLILNQANTTERRASGLALAGLLGNSYPSILIADIPNGPDWLQNGPAEGDEFIHSVHEGLAGIVLAAGASTRFKEGPKQLLVWRGEPLVRHVARLALDSGLDPVCVVTGAYQAEVREALQDLPVLLVENPNWESGQSTSVKAGIRQIPTHSGGVVFLLADQPQIPRTLVRTLAECHSRTLAPIVAPLAGGRRSNPVLFDRDTFDDLAHIRGDEGGRGLFSKYPVEWLEWLDEDILLDVDTPEDFAAFLEKYPDFMS